VKCLHRSSIFNHRAEDNKGSDGADDAGSCDGGYAAFYDRGRVAGELRRGASCFGYIEGQDVDQRIYNLRAGKQELVG
jgi:hypothetical protein